jgi:ribulose-phosphate 3-epimerase
VTRLAPSILAADYAHLADEVAKVEPHVEWLHLDVMDGHFVPNLTIGPAVVASLRRASRLYFDCHLMIERPWVFLEPFRAAGADLCSVHVEAGDPERSLAEMDRVGLGRGLAVSPDTPIDTVWPYLERLELLLVMTVVPGFGGQSFISATLDKVRAARARIDSEGLSTLIEVDGGVDASTAPLAAEAGADVFVAGTAIFGRPDPAQSATELRQAVDVARRSRQRVERTPRDPDVPDRPSAEGTRTRP